ncbi:peptidase S58 family protein [Nakamurella sp. YIM 132087]|uniref:Peptidase S58 family protein n=1 Tax=Nakamurella alba TaxID=2665158 RepID=A0A7K1FLP7_9ACTN|nr:P1 family peptidase [Nakamurella alba]MTD13814.1 peptidase S58 family protein [Nakamurella alba]
MTVPEPAGGAGYVAFEPAPGPHNDLTDIPGLRLGHHDRIGDGYLSGTTVLLAPPGGMAAGVDVRGGAPGTRETDLLHPTASIERVHAIVLTGGSAYGLTAAGGAAEALEEQGIGFPVGRDPAEIVPIVPAAVLFDLGRGGSFRARPDADFGRAAVADALLADPGRMRRTGLVGAGTGAAACGLKGGLGMASAVLKDGTVVAALMATNAAGSPLDRRTGELLGARFLHVGDVAGGVPAPDDEQREALLTVIRGRDPHLVAASRRPGPVIENTTIGIVATDASLSKSQCTKLAGVAHDGLARALNPVHTAFDGDTVFGVATCARPAPDDLGLHDILTAAADVVTRAVVRSLLAATSVTTPADTWPSYSDLAAPAGR